MTQIYNTYIEDVLKSLLQDYLTFYIKGKVFKEGRLLLYKQNNFHLALTVENNKRGIFTFEIPIPFSIELHSMEDDDELENELVYFDYRLATLAKNNKEVVEKLAKMPKVGNSKFYDTIVEIEIKNEVE
jgi:hypothetical protein